MRPDVGGSRKRSIWPRCRVQHQHEISGLWKKRTVEKEGGENYVMGWDELLTLRISSRVLSSGERPPWIQKNCLFMIAARGSAQNEFMQASYILSEYLRLPDTCATIFYEKKDNCGIANIRGNRG